MNFLWLSTNSFSLGKQTKPIDFGETPKKWSGLISAVKLAFSQEPPVKDGMVVYHITMSTKGTMNNVSCHVHVGST